MTSRRTDGDPLILLATFGTLGDLRPFVLMASALQDRGHRVLLIAPGLHEHALPASGLPYALYGTAADAAPVLADRDLWHPRKGIGVLLRSLLPCIEAVAALVAERSAAGPCRLICHPVLLPVVDLARAAGPGSLPIPRSMPVVGAWLAPSNLRTCDDPLTIGALTVPRWLPTVARRGLWWAIDRFGVDPHILPGLNALRARAGLPAVRRFALHLQASCDASIGLFPGWFGPWRRGWPDRFIEATFPLPPIERAPAMSPALLGFLSAGPPPVVFTAGTGMQQADRFFAQALVALQRLGRRGVFVTPHAGQLPVALAPSVHHEAFVDFARLLPDAAAVVHHGGIGTVAEALRAGVPQLVVPFGFDQFDNAARVRALGVGDMLPARRLRSDRLQRALGRLLASADVALGCRSTAARLADDAGSRRPGAGDEISQGADIDAPRLADQRSARLGERLDAALTLAAGRR